MADRDFRFGIYSNVQGVDLNRLLINHALSTYFMRVADDMPEIDLQSGDILLIDRTLQPRKNDLVVISLPDDEQLRIIRFANMYSELELWGVVEHLIRKLRP